MNKALKALVWMWVLFALIVVLTLLVPRREHGEPPYRVMCASKLRQIGTAIAIYANENGGTYPDSFATALRTEDLVPGIFICTTTETKAASSAAAFVGSTADCDYVYVGDGLTIATAMDGVIVAFDRPANHDGDGVNVLFGDGHVEFVPSYNLKPRPGRKHEDDWWTSVQAQIASSARPIRMPTPTTLPTTSPTTTPRPSELQRQ